MAFVNHPEFFTGPEEEILSFAGRDAHFSRPAEAVALVLFSGAADPSIVQSLQRQGMATLVLDLPPEISSPLARVEEASAWAEEHFPELPLGYCGFGDGLTNLLPAAVKHEAFAVVGVEGRISLLETKLPILLLGEKSEIVEHNRLALELLPRGRLVETKEKVSHHLQSWLQQHLPPLESRRGRANPSSPHASLSDHF